MAHIDVSSYIFCFFCYIRSNTLLTSVFLPDNLIGSFVGNPIESGIFVNPHKITDFIQKSYCSATFLYKNSQKRIFNENIFSNFLKILCFCIFLQHLPVFDKSSPNLCVHSSSSYVSPSMLPLSSGDLIEWSLVCHSTLSYQKFCDRHSNHYDHPEELHQSVE